ncbi:hypothetical protein D0469_17305 [Peribacillus saganii]|uniref:Uncharacterized protein n=1 Tax=Peribacillus saganii TaxID=2303992 RepID=A0A372LJ56_9BACI|nr:CLC_0170 family protein [Peribacillus saganii]RFU66390.1 hypothetical protein D0469_17305 [Peribacillus saganii]
MVQIGYINYLVIIFIVTGIFILRYDAGTYKVAKMKKEYRVARITGWVNIVMGIFIYGANWAYETFFW